MTPNSDLSYFFSDLRTPNSLLRTGFKDAVQSHRLLSPDCLSSPSGRQISPTPRPGHSSVWRRNPYEPKGLHLQSCFPSSESQALSGLDLSPEVWYRPGECPGGDKPLSSPLRNSSPPLQRPG